MADPPSLKVQFERGGEWISTSTFNPNRHICIEK